MASCCAASRHECVQVSDMLNMRVFVDTDDDVRLARRQVLWCYCAGCA